MDVNSTNFVGRLAEPVTYTPGDGQKSSRATGHLIVNRPPRKNKTERELDKIPFVVWGPRADAMAKYTSKGKEIAISGPIRTNSVRPKYEGDRWENYWEVEVEKLSFGHDSSTQKAMKAIQDGGKVEESSLKEFLDANPTMAAAINKVRLANLPPPPPPPAKKPAGEEIAATATPFDI